MNKFHHSQQLSRSMNRLSVFSISHLITAGSVFRTKVCEVEHLAFRNAEKEQAKKKIGTSRSQEYGWVQPFSLKSWTFKDVRGCSALFPLSEKAVTPWDWGTTNATWRFEFVNAAKGPEAAHLRCQLWKLVEIAKAVNAPRNIAAEYFYFFLMSTW